MNIFFCCCCLFQTLFGHSIYISNAVMALDFASEFHIPGRLISL